MVKSIEDIKVILEDAGIILVERGDKLEINSMGGFIPFGPGPSIDVEKGRGWLMYVSMDNPAFKLGNDAIKQLLQDAGFDVKFSAYDMGGRMFVFEEM